MRLMRIMVMFDLPTGTKLQRKVANRFRKDLISDGFTRFQFSIYSRIVNGADGIDKHHRRLEKMVPREGSVRVLTITERQYEDMKFLVGSETIQEKMVGSMLQLEF